jgi:hypothetical protein
VKEALIVMAILGCADDGSQCQQVRQPPVAYASIDACNAAAEAELTQASTLAYPSLYAQCQSISKASFAELRDRAAN